MPLDEAALNRTLQQAAELFVNPEIKRRHEDGQVPSLPMRLWAFQVIFPGDGGHPNVRLNEEIRAVAKGRTKPGVNVEKGAPIQLGDLAAIESLTLVEPEDLNSGHMTVIWLGQREVFMSFDFRRNKQLVAELVAAAAEFLESAKHAIRESKSWSVFVDNLYSALELSVKAFLWTNPWGSNFKKKMPHTAIRSVFVTFPTALNGMSEANTALQQLAAERNTARYLHKPIVPRWEEGESWLKAAEEMLERAQAEAEVIEMETLEI